MVVLLFFISLIGALCVMYAASKVTQVSQRAELRREQNDAYKASLDHLHMELKNYHTVLQNAAKMYGLPYTPSSQKELPLFVFEDTQRFIDHLDVIMKALEPKLEKPLDDESVVDSHINANRKRLLGPLEERFDDRGNYYPLKQLPDYD